MATSQPIHAEQYEVPRYPVRDDLAIGPTEDLDREPDGVPHQVVGMTAAFSVMLAMLVAAIFVTGGVIGHVAAVVLALLAIPLMVVSLRKKSARDRDHVHPSR
jgi:hypothetical protein